MRKINNSGDIVKQLKEEISAFSFEAETQKVGFVSRVGDGVVTIQGLSEARAGEVIMLGKNTPALVMNLEDDHIGAVILGGASSIHEHTPARLTGTILETPVGDNFVGRVIDALGNPVDGRGAINSKIKIPAERSAPGVIDREPVNAPLFTGIKAVDAMIPIGRGQRELIIGDRQTGKTAIAVDTILNQKDSGVICIYVAIGQKESKIAKLVSELKARGAMEYTIVVVSGASSAAALQYLAPYMGCALGEYFMEKGQDALVVYDDLSKHAAAYREISLLLRRPPGREAYPGDVFYLHSRLLERSAKLSKAKGGGSLTAFPIIETQAGDISAYIPTNVISITDGQIFLESDLFYAGTRPALNIGLSVSRVGSKAQAPIMKKLAGKLKLEAAQFRELAAFAQFGSDVDEKTRQKIERGQRIMEVLKQDQFTPMSLFQQVVILYAVMNGYFDRVKVGSVKEVEKKLHEYALGALRKVEKQIIKKPELSPTVEAELKKALEAFVDSLDETDIIK